MRLSAPQFLLGEKVRVISGVFVESPALYDGMSGRDRVAVLLDLPGGRVRVSLDAGLIAAA
jgi:transcription antitermination factor NusG